MELVVCAGLGEEGFRFSTGLFVRWTGKIDIQGILDLVRAVKRGAEWRLGEVITSLPLLSGLIRDEGVLLLRMKNIYCSGAEWTPLQDHLLRAVAEPRYVL